MDSYTGRDMTQEQLAQAIELARAGHKEQARQLFIELLHQDKHNVTLWKWLTTVAVNEAEARQAINYVLAIDPSDAWATRALAALNKRIPASRQGNFLLAAAFSVIAIMMCVLVVIAISGILDRGGLLAGQPEVDDPGLGPDAPVAAVASGPTLPPSWTPSPEEHVASVTPVFTQTATSTPAATVTKVPSPTPNPFGLPADGSGQIVETRAEEFFQVSGTNADEINQSIIDNGPKGTGQDAIAQIQYQIGLQYAFQESQAACTPLQAVGLLDLTFLYPDYVPSVVVPSEILAQWDTFFLRVVEHEETHAQIARECTQALLVSYYELGVFQTCSELEQSIEIIQDDNDAACEARQLAFDEEQGGDNFP